MLYAETRKDAKAMNQIKKAISILEKNKDYYAISDYLTYMSDIYIKRNNPEKALEYATQSLNLATKYGLKKQISISISIVLTIAAIRYLKGQMYIMILKM